MTPSAVLLAAALAAVLAPGAGLPVGRRGPRNKLLLVSFDGFRWDYDQDVETPHLDAMALDGVKARYMTPAFVTMTSPCHFTLVTGECRPQAGAWGLGGVGKPGEPGAHTALSRGAPCGVKGETERGPGHRQQTSRWPKQTAGKSRQAVVSFRMAATAG